MDEERRQPPTERPGQPGGARDRNRRERTAALIEAGTRLFLAAGVEAVTIDEIAREAGTAKGNFYRYFKDKADLVAAVLDPAASRTREALLRCEEEIEQANDAAQINAAYARLATALIECVAREPDGVRLYLQEKRMPGGENRAAVRELDAELEAAVVRLSSRARDRGLLRVDDPRVSALAVLGAVETLTLGHLRGDLGFEPAAAGATLIKLVMDGIRS